MSRSGLWIDNIRVHVSKDLQLWKQGTFWGIRAARLVFDCASCMASLVPKKVTLWTLEVECGNSEYFGKVDVGGVTTLRALKFTLETNDLLEWPFDF